LSCGPRGGQNGIKPEGAGNGDYSRHSGFDAEACPSGRALRGNRCIARNDRAGCLPSPHPIRKSGPVSLGNAADDIARELPARIYTGDLSADARHSSIGWKRSASRKKTIAPSSVMTKPPARQVAGPLRGMECGYQVHHRYLEFSPRNGCCIYRGWRPRRGMRQS